MIGKLRRRFVLINMAIVTVMLCAVLGLVISFTQSRLEQEEIQALREISQDPFGSLTFSGNRTGIPYFALLIQPSGSATILTDGNFDLSDEEWLSSIVTEAYESENQTGVIADYSLRYYKASGFLTQYLIFSDISGQQQILKNLIRNSVIIGLVGFAGFFLISLWLSRVVVKPVEEAWQREHRFIQDASHELKTPLTVILTNAEFLEDDRYEEAEKKKFADNIRTMGGRMKNMVEELLSLERVENGIPEESFAKVCLSERLEENLLVFEPSFYENGHVLQSEVEPDLSVMGAASYLDELIDILLDNANKYAEPDSTIEVSLKKEGSRQVKLEVASAGPEIPAEKRKQLFSRFYRMDEARSTGSGDSFGLGLAIAAGIAQAHKTKIDVTYRDGKNIFSVRFLAI